MGSTTPALWSFLDGAGSQPASCDGVSDTTEMASCIADWRAGNYNNPLFTLAIADAVRFGAVPVLDAGAWGNGTSTYGIADIVPVYVEGSFWGCNSSGSNGNGNGNGNGGGSGSSCAIIHYPADPSASSGLGSTVNGANRLNAVTAFVLDVEMLPEPLRSNFPTSPEQVDYALTK